ncbi:hypothetical protein GCM10011507_13020 [Edaphobacter acidisoli]|uniref:Uncharacterized protein n=1 Tax=Edaphobacter acidisoli TaxID=2040573 RepID=A0A916W370_9BACT|nr:hypothetical protein [Edaphobacter acidisoli]GGA62822.1 hypothetical protein GCM10011507_13020 [Edaphobacter acidisoli]
MHLPLTFGLISALTAAMLVVRVYWQRIPRAFKTALVVFAAGVIIIFFGAYATKWRISSGRLNFAFCWALLASWEILLLLFSLLKPRWLTGIIAVVMLLPLLSASIIFPLASALGPLPATTIDLGDHILSERTPWGTGTFRTTGTDLTLYYQPAWMPFLRLSLRSARYYNGQCDADAAYAVLQPDGSHVQMVCPAASYLPADSARTITLPLYRSMFHSPIKKATSSPQ